MFLRPRFLLSSHRLYYNSDVTNWNQTEPVRDSALGWTVWSSGRSGAHADQPSDQKHGFPARVRRKNRRFRGAQFTSTFRSIKQQLAHDSKQSSDFRRITILLQVELTSRKLVQTWIVKQLFQVFASLCQRKREIETKTLGSTSLK